MFKGLEDSLRAESSGETEVLRLESEVVMVVMSMVLLERGSLRPEVTVVTPVVTVLTPGTVSAVTRASVGALSI